MMEVAGTFATGLTVNGVKITNEGTPEHPLFRTKHIGSLLGLSNIRESIKDFDEVEKLTKQIATTSRGLQTVSFLTEVGLIRLIAFSRKPFASELAKRLGMRIKFKIQTYEATTLCQIMEAFEGEEMVSEFTVGKFRIDLYFTRYKIAVECDENNHRHAVEKDNERQRRIEAILGCTFVRYRPDVKDFNVFKVINQIYKLVMAKQGGVASCLGLNETRVIDSIGHEMDESLPGNESQPEQQQQQQQPKRKSGRPPKAKVAPATTAETPLQRFLDECFDCDESPDEGHEKSRTHVAHVRARHRLWRQCHVGREETNAMVEFFKQRFDVVQEMDEGRDWTCSSFYLGLTMKPWVLPAQAEGSDEEVHAFVRAECEVHVMGRARTSDLWDAFILWKQMQKQQQQPYDPTGAERARFITRMKAASFVYHTGVPTTSSGIGTPGFYGLYLSTATDECREVGYNRSPNTHTAVVRLDEHGNVVATFESQDAFAQAVAKKSSQYVGKELARRFSDGMKGLTLGDGYVYMRASDHKNLLSSRGGT